MKFPVFKTKIAGIRQKFDLTDFKERQAYFEAKAGTDIKKLRRYLEHNSFIAYLLGKKIPVKALMPKCSLKLLLQKKYNIFLLAIQLEKLTKN